MSLTIPPVEEIFKDEIALREQFSEFYNQKVKEIVLEELEMLSDKVQEFGGLLFVIGSRAWEKNLESKRELYNSLPLIYKNSVTSGNYDIMIAGTSEDVLNSCMLEVCKTVDEVMRKLNEQQEFLETFQMEYITNVDNGNEFTPIKYPFYTKSLSKKCGVFGPLQTAGCVSPLCKAIHVEMSYSPLDKKKKSSKYSLKFDGKVLLYIECFITTAKGIDSIVDNLLTESENIQYLNWKGLFLFAEMIFKRNKEYDIDKYRREILEKYFGGNAVLDTYYKNVITLYSQIFKSDSPAYKLTLETLYKKYIDLMYPNLITELNGVFIEKFRKLINSYIFDLDATQEIGSPSVAMFVTGGDAYRRYLQTKMTSDIDIKILYSRQRDDIPLFNIVVSKLCILVCLLYTYKEVILPPNGYTTANGIKVDSVYDSGQFRIRITEQETFTLVSLDYKYRVRISDGVKLYYTLPIIDNVLQYTKKLDKESIIEYDTCIPIASSTYLKEDIYNIYKQITDNTKMRSGKSSKDSQRFTNLLRYIEKNKQSLDIVERRGVKRKASENCPVDVKRRFGGGGEGEDVVSSRANPRSKLIDELAIEDNHLSQKLPSLVYENLITENKDFIKDYTNLAFEKLQAENSSMKISFNTVKDLAVTEVDDLSGDLAFLKLN